MSETKMPSAQWLMDEHKDATLIARLYLMFAKAQELERELEQLKLFPPTAYVTVTGGVASVDTRGPVEILHVDFDDLNRALGFATADEDVRRATDAMRKWANVTEDWELEREADEYDEKHEDAKGKVRNR